MDSSINSLADQLAVSSWFISLAAFSLAAIATFVGLFWYLKLRKQDISERRFFAYHAIVERLNTATGGHSGQLACIFELRNFPEYAEISIRLLESLEKFWTSEAGRYPFLEHSKPSIERVIRLQQEIALTIVNLKGKTWGRW